MRAKAMDKSLLENGEKMYTCFNEKSRRCEDLNLRAYPKQPKVPGIKTLLLLLRYVCVCVFVTPSSPPSTSSSSSSASASTSTTGLHDRFHASSFSVSIVRFSREGFLFVRRGFANAEAYGAFLVSFFLLSRVCRGVEEALAVSDCFLWVASFGVG